MTENINSRAAEHILAVSEFAAQADAYFEMEAERILEEKLFKKKRRGETAKFQKCGGSRWKRAWDRVRARRWQKMR